MNHALITAAFLAIAIGTSGQSNTTESLRTRHSGALNLFFYKNTLRMLNQTDDREFDELTKDIEKMRFMLINKAEEKFGDTDYRNLVSDYQSEQFEAVMTSRHDGKNFDVYLKEKEGKTKGILVLVNDSENLYILDILGKIALDKITSFYDKIDQTTDIGMRIRQFSNHEHDN